MAKCKECLGCTKYVWVDGIRFLFCDFCGKYYKIVNEKLVETVPDSLKVPKKQPIKATKLPIDKKKYTW